MSLLLLLTGGGAPPPPVTRVIGRAGARSDGAAAFAAQRAAWAGPGATSGGATADEESDAARGSTGSAGVEGGTEP